jgi:hypothetical protein
MTVVVAITIVRSVVCMCGEKQVINENITTLGRKKLINIVINNPADFGLNTKLPCACSHFLPVL